MLNNNNIERFVNNDKNNSYNLTYLWLFGMDNNIFSYIYILQRKPESENKLAIIRTTPKVVIKFYMPVTYCC